MSREEAKRADAAACLAENATDGERIDLAAAAILEKYRAAFEELAK